MTSGRGRKLGKPGEFKSRTEGYMNPMGNDFKVLVVDDSPVSRKLVELPLAQKRYKLIFPKTGQEAIKLFHQHRPNLVFLDLLIPDLPQAEMSPPIRSS